ncbi:MAG: hypothetical protein Q9188_006102 [Gyalolechia gomerana]
MQVIASFALLTALWQTTLGSSPSIYPAVSSSINHFCSTDLSEKACTTPPSTNPADSLNQIETRAHEATTNTASTEDPGPNPQCPRWDGLPWVPFEKREDPGSSIPYDENATGAGFVVWYDIDFLYRPPVNPHILDLQNLHGATGHSLAQCMRSCVVLNKATTSQQNCTAVTLTRDGVCYLKQGSDGTNNYALTSNTTSVLAPGFASAMMIPPRYQGNKTFTRPVYV